MTIRWTAAWYRRSTGRRRIRYESTAADPQAGESLDELLAEEEPDTGTEPGDDAPDLGWDENATAGDIARLALGDGADERAWPTAAGRRAGHPGGPGPCRVRRRHRRRRRIRGGSRRAPGGRGPEDDGSTPVRAATPARRPAAARSPEALTWKCSAEPVITPEDHVLGPADAPVTVLEYGDYECPYCRGAYRDVHRLLDEYPGPGAVRVPELPDPAAAPARRAGRRGGGGRRRARQVLGDVRAAAADVGQPGHSTR